MPKKEKYYRRKEDGLYETSRNVNGKRIRFRGRTVQEVDRKILEFNIAQKKGRKFPVIAQEWIALHAEDIAASSLRVYEPAVRRAAEHFTGYASEIRPLDVKRYVLDFESKGYARQTVAIELGVIKQIFAHAVVSGDIDVSPAVEVKHSRRLPKTKRPALTEEQERLVEQCRSGDWWLMGLMFLYTGCRRGELLALTWQDIDRANGVIRITKKLNYALGNTPTLEHHLKSENGKREIPIFGPLAAALPTNRIGKIFTGPGGDYLTDAQARKAWSEYCSVAGLMAAKDGKVRPAVTPHQFRHSFATICYEAGLDPKATAAIVGDTEAMVRDVYTDLRDRHKATSAERVNAFLEMRAAERAAL